MAAINYPFQIKCLAAAREKESNAGSIDVNGQLCTFLIVHLNQKEQYNHPINKREQHIISFFCSVEASCATLQKDLNELNTVKSYFGKLASYI